MGVGFGGEEGAERRELAEDLSASLRVGNGVYWFAATRVEALRGRPRMAS
jgi:hypothetical protein